jgi:hypothetical protein
VRVASALRRRKASAARRTRETRRWGVKFVWNLLVSTRLYIRLYIITHVIATFE